MRSIVAITPSNVVAASKSTTTDQDVEVFDRLSREGESFRVCRNHTQGCFPFSAVSLISNQISSPHKCFPPHDHVMLWSSILHKFLHVYGIIVSSTS